MAEDINTTRRGNDIVVWATFYNEDENLSDTDVPPTVEVWKEGLQVLGPVEMEHYGIGTYRYVLDTSVLSPGFYYVVVRGAVGGIDVVQEHTLEVVEPWVESESS